jgi:hypothetical protein
MSAWVAAKARRVISWIAIIAAILLAIGLLLAVLKYIFHTDEGAATAIAWFSVMVGGLVVWKRKEILANGYSERLANLWALGMATLVVVVLAIAEGLGIVLQLDPLWQEGWLPLGVLLIALVCLLRGEGDDGRPDRQSRPFLGHRLFTSMADGFRTSVSATTDGARGLGTVEDRGPGAQTLERRVSSPALEPPFSRRRKGRGRSESS